MKRPVRLGISTCPNDTFAFHALIEGLVDRRGLTYAVEYLDVEELNTRMAAGAFDVAKVSFHAALALGDDVVVLPSGAALGFGVGPVVLAADPRALRLRAPHVLCPGQWTTAHLLWRLLHPDRGRIEQRVFSEIVPALQRGEADLGVCIHEARFTYEAHGLELVEDLGQAWEDEVGEALPLGGIVGRRKLGSDRLRRVQATLSDSLAWAQAHREDCLPTMRRHAQERDDAVLWKHVELYVNEWTHDLGTRGRSALEVLAWRARTAGLVAPEARPLEILG